MVWLNSLLVPGSSSISFFYCGQQCRRDSQLIAIATAHETAMTSSSTPHSESFHWQPLSVVLRSVRIVYAVVLQPAIFLNLGQVNKKIAAAIDSSLAI